MGRGSWVRAQPVCEEELRCLARRIRQRNSSGREFIPYEVGCIGDEIGACIFCVELADDRNRRRIDGHFKVGRLAGKTVNIRMYSTRDRDLDIHPPHRDGPDYHLVLTGPEKHAEGSPKPLGIEEVFLFETELLVSTHGASDDPTSVPDNEWNDARIYRASPPFAPELDPQQQEMLRLFRLTNPPKPSDKG